MAGSKFETVKQKMISWMHGFRRSIVLHRDWYCRSVLLPFIATRLIWIAVGLFAVNFMPNPTYAEYAQRGWFLSPHFLIDLWTHWDAKWYLSIVETGYQPSADLTSTISNVAFFPLYPYLIKAVSWLLPGALISRSVYLLIGLLISNFSFLVGAGLLYRLILDYSDQHAAERTLQLLFVFPTSFYFSTFYTESLFFLLAIAVFFAAMKRHWWIAGILSGLLTLTRPQGIFIMLPMMYLYFDFMEWKLTNIKIDLLALFFPVIAFAGHLYNLHKLTGSWIAPLLAQKSWGRLETGYLNSLWIEIGDPVLDVFKFDFLFLLLFLFTSILLMGKSRSRSLGIYSFFIVFIPLLTGSVVSVSRFVLVAFPVFAYWGAKISSPGAFKIVQAVLWTFQILFFLGWVNYYWIA